MPTPIVTDGSMDKLRDYPHVLTPLGAPGLFSNRAARFDHLGQAERGMGPYLRLMGHVCRGQARAFSERSAEAPSDEALARSRDHGMPPLADALFRRDPAWQKDLQTILAEVLEKAHLPEPGATQIRALLEQSLSGDGRIESIADALLSGMELNAEDGACAPFVGAALQTYFTRLASKVPPSDVEHSDIPNVCPCCGMRPTASLVSMEPDRINGRYLICSLCMTEWNLERVKCSACLKEGDVSYLVVDDRPEATTRSPIRAETCDACKAYLKIFVQDNDPLMDVLADDLGSLELDIMVDEQGYSRTGPNLLFYPGHE
ncbi:MAG: formate dehydrogenase accessory protein FdhE [Betaproteobacteria bacterium]|nr:formate dehydrogenase accessory protein FdhE [Betaproteobacteria bacterium]NBT75828.1 formate dehydrogenase accessory protein FdhE [Betaproteobacteria bacterium]NBY13844.1 formate dehydrogenase accessory protein FdhE [Betaproteobacteria bacterium]NCA16101.1 formate dehydrogenase accessory protein FdhE [Betaproteobacteria bacterium]